jgi:hypothetical protein
VKLKISDRKSGFSVRNFADARKTTGISVRKLELSVRKFDFPYGISYTLREGNYFSSREHGQNQPGKRDYPGSRR